MAKGGPGCGKKTVARKIDEHGFQTVFLRSLLVTESEANSEAAAVIKEAIANKSLVPLDVIIKVLKAHLLKEVKNTNKFCIIGFPKTIDQITRFEKEIGQPEVAIFLRVSDETMTIRKKQAAAEEGIHLDDVVIENKVKLFKEQEFRCVDYYVRKKKLCEVNADAPIDDVWLRSLGCIKKK